MGKLYARLALGNIRRERQFYLPYFLTVLGTAAALYVAGALSGGGDLPDKARFAYLSMFMTIGVGVLTVFAAIFLTYTNSFLAKRRRRELGLYNILGMGKGHIARVLFWETVYLALGGILGGILLGAVLQWLGLWALSAALGGPGYFSPRLAPGAAAGTAGTIGAILLFNLVLNLRRVHAQRPVELLRETAAGEREPKTRWVLAALGVLTLGGGYAIALRTRSATEAIALYFLAVLLVILGTYCLFIAVSIVILKALRKNKRFYYRTTHFIGLSGMLHRMKRNGAGLATICILCTMVLVMVSGTLCLYLGSERNLRDRFPGEAAMTVRYTPGAEAPLDKGAMAEAFRSAAREAGYDPRGVGEEEYMSFRLARQEDGTFLDLCSDPEGLRQARRWYFTAMTPETYTYLTGIDVPDDGLGRLCLGEVEGDALTLRLGEGGTGLWSCALGEALPAAPRQMTAFAYLSDFDCFLVLPREKLLELLAARGEVEMERWELTWQSHWDLGGDPEGHQAALNAMTDPIINAETGAWSFLDLESRAHYGEDYYGLNSGFFFLGVFLGLIFLLATVLIIYYKQLSEGYEDQSRYHIMLQVGLESRDVDRSVHSQMGVVFFAPLLVAAVHLAFDFPLVARLLTLFGVRDTGLFLGCTLGALGAFTLVYLLVYRLTARAYCRIVG